MNTAGGVAYWVMGHSGPVGVAVHGGPGIDHASLQPWARDALTSDHELRRDWSIILPLYFSFRLAGGRRACGPTLTTEAPTTETFVSI